MAQSAMITIRRQVLDVEVQGTESDALALYRRLPDVCADVLSLALESAFESIDPGVAYLYVERLAIELSGVSVERLEAELAEAVRREIPDFFRRNPSVRDAAAAPGDVQRRTEGETVDDALVVFLRTGRLPWSFRVPTGGRLEQLVVDAWMRSDANGRPPPGMRARLVEVLAMSSARTRLVLQFSPGFVGTVLRRMSPQIAAAIDDVLAAVGELGSSAPARTAFVRRLWAPALAAAAGGNEPAPRELVRAAWHASGPAARQDHVLAAVIEQRWPGVIDQQREVADGHQAAVALPTSSESATHLDEQTGLSTSLESNGVDSIVVDNAGVVLVHPFLPRLLEGLGIAAGDELIDRGRAVCLIHNLATGELVAPEHQLTLAKLLCGVPLEEPVEADVGLTEDETAKAVAMLEAAIGHWETLRGTSPDSLRGEFLTRPGTLADDADGDWLLRVEARTVDILLDQLPWGISLVKLPWMRRLLRVEWR